MERRMGQQQAQQPGTSREQKQKRKGFSRRQRLIATIVAALIVALAIATAQVLSGAKIIPDIWVTISNAIVGTFGMIFTFFALIPLLFPSDDPQQVSTTATQVPTSSPAVASPQPIIIQLQQPTLPQPLPPAIPQPPIPVKPVTGNITGSFPPTDPKTIQQRRKLVEEVYAALTKPDINCIVLTGIGGMGKSTAAALVYKYAEEQRKDGKGLFAAEALWITVEETTATFAYLAEIISAALGKPIPDFGKLPPQNQAAAFFNVLNTPDHTCLIVINQFENLLDSQTGQATDPALGEWLDILNSRLCRCRVLLTSRPMPRGTQDYPPTHVQEYPVAGLATNEGVDLLRKQGVQTAQATEAELRIAVVRCAGHALSLELLASILRRNQSLSLHSLFDNPLYAQLWTGNIARRLLDYIYEQQLDDVQRQLLRAFSVYREPVPLEAAQVLLEATASQTRVLDALNVLLSQHLLQDIGKECYQLHAIVAEYARRRFDERDEQANKQVLRAAHVKAARYYIQQAATSCPPREKRRVIEDVRPLIEAFWQYCQAGQWQEAYILMMVEGLFADLSRWGRNTILLELCQLLLPLDNWQPQPWQESDIYYYLGRAYEVLGQKKHAIGYYERALEIEIKEKNRLGEGNMLNNLGLVYNTLGKNREALTYLEQALAIRREVGNRGAEGATLNNLGAVYNDLGKKQEALSYYEQALAIYREVGDRRGEGGTLNNLGLVYNALGKKQEALSHYEQALAILREVGDRGGEGATLWIIGALYIQQGHYDVALAFLLLAKGIFEEVQSPNRDGVQSRINDLRKKVGKKQFTTLLAQVEPQVSQIVERALHEGL
jgi:tetratricopeptide (TPR) repeat protein